jgi:hypothetical protein
MERRRVIRAIVITLATIALTVGLGYGFRRLSRGRITRRFFEEFHGADHGAGNFTEWRKRSGPAS